MFHISKYSLFLLRLPIALSLFGHGFVRMPKLQVFSNWMVGSMKKSFLPESIIIPFSYALPVAELLIGFLLIIGLFTRQAAATGILVMAILIFGSTTIENWDPITSQLVHSGYLGVIMLLCNHDRFSVDYYWKNK